MQLSGDRIQEAVHRALAEDLGEAGDLTVAASVPPGTRGRAVIEARQEGVVAGLGIARACFLARDENAEFHDAVADGASVAPGAILLTVDGLAAGLLSAERTALNFLQRLSGIATRTAEFAAAVADLPVQVLDTRKTTPGLRHLEKYAVSVGGGHNHRVGLFDQILLKENHFALAGRPYQDVVREAVASASAPVVAEAQTVEEAFAAVRGGAEIVLLDNFAPGPERAAATERIRSLAADLGRSVSIEASGGVTIRTVRAFAECGVDRISVGALTHSVEAFDLSMLTESIPDHP